MPPEKILLLPPPTISPQDRLAIEAARENLETLVDAMLLLPKNQAVLAGVHSALDNKTDLSKLGENERG